MGETSPMMASSVVVLPTPLRPSRQVMPPADYVEIDTVEDARARIAGDEVPDLEQCRHQARLPR